MAASPFKMADLSRGKESLGPKPGKITSPPYSYEHRITLDGNTLGKLGVDIPSVGDQFHVMGHGEVQHVSQSDGEGGKNVSVQLQLKKLGLRKKGAAGLKDAIESGIKDASND